MKVVILAGGFGTRLSEETEVKPKPMVEVGGKPLLWHIMKTYSHFGYNDFILCLGYKGYVIKEYFANYFLHQANVTIDLTTNGMEIHDSMAEPWKITLVDTGLTTMTGGRIKRIEKYVGKETFMLTYGDGLGSVDISKLYEFHKKHGKLATVTAVQPSGRFGALDLNDAGNVIAFQEKPRGDGMWINGGFFVFDSGVFDYISGDESILERKPLEDISKDEQLMAFRHKDFWHPLDTLRDKKYLEEMWNTNNPPWKIWE